MPKGKPNAKWLKLTEEQNAVDYLETAYAALQRTPRDRLAWKWVVIGLHGALYGFAICVLKGTDYTQVLDPKFRRHRRLIDFDKAIKRCQDAPGSTQRDLDDLQVVRLSRLSGVLARRRHVSSDLLSPRPGPRARQVTAAPGGLRSPCRAGDRTGRGWRARASGATGDPVSP